jgi:RNA polymerase sigma factor (sigma-70 family)
MQDKWPVENTVSDADAELLRQYAEQGSHAAFDALVNRHFAFVKSVCLRCLGDRELADDATQVVFLVLARKASGLRTREFLPAWLFQTARLTCKDLRKREVRRINYERQAAQERVRENAAYAASWLDVEPIIDDMLARLKADDRNALLLRFYGEEDFSVIARTMGISEQAARMRISRALNKIRGWLAQEGIGISAATLLAWMTTGTEPHLTHDADFVCHILDPSTNPHTIILSKGTLKTMGALKIKAITAATLTVAVVATGGVMVGKFAAAGPPRARAGSGSPYTASRRSSRVDPSWSTKLPDGTDIRLTDVLIYDDRSRNMRDVEPGGRFKTSAYPGKGLQSDNILLDRNNVGDARVHTFRTPVHTSIGVTIFENSDQPMEADMDHVAPVASHPGRVNITLKLSKGPYTKLVEDTFSYGDTRTLTSGAVVSITRAMKHLGSFRSGENVVDVTTLKVTAPARMVESQCGFNLDAINADGAITQLPHGGGYSESARDPRTHVVQLVYRFRTQELNNAHVERFQFSYRPIYTIVFRNVAITPK